MSFSESLVVDIVGGYPGLAVVLEEWGIDSGRYGGYTLRVVCAAQNLDLEELCRLLETASQANPNGLAGFSRAQLVAHVREVHHEYLRRQLPVLEEASGKAARLYGSEHQQLRHVDQILRILAEELQQHLQREELFAFPWLGLADIRQDFGAVATFGPSKQLAQSGEAEVSPLDLWMLDCLAEERRKSSFRLSCLRFLTNHFSPPESAGESMRRLYSGLRDLDRDFQRHVYIEERYLFPPQLAA